MRTYFSLAIIAGGLIPAFLVSCSIENIPLEEPTSTFAGRYLIDSGYRETSPGQWQTYWKPGGRLCVEVLDLSDEGQERLEQFFVETDRRGYFRFTSQKPVVAFCRRAGVIEVFETLGGRRLEPGFDARELQIEPAPASRQSPSKTDLSVPD